MEIQRKLRFENVPMAGRSVTVVVEQTIDSDTLNSAHVFACEGDGLLLTLDEVELDGIVVDFDNRVVEISRIPRHDVNFIGFSEQEISIELIEGQVYVGRDEAWLGQTSLQVETLDARHVLALLEGWSKQLEILTKEGKPSIDTTAANAQPTVAEYALQIAAARRERYGETATAKGFAFYSCRADGEETD